MCKSTNVLLNPDVLPAVKERRVRWTTYANLNAWFDNLRAFLIEFDFASIGDNGAVLTFTEAQLRRIMNVDETEVSLDESNTRAGGRPAMSFHDPHLPLTSRSTAKLLLACTGIFGSSAAGKCVPRTSSCRKARQPRRERDPIQVLNPHFGHTRYIWLRGGEDLAVHDWDEQKGRNDGQ